MSPIATPEPCKSALLTLSDSMWAAHLPFMLSNRRASKTVSTMGLPSACFTDEPALLNKELVIADLTSKQMAKIHINMLFQSLETRVNNRTSPQEIATTIGLLFNCMAAFGLPSTILGPEYGDHLMVAKSIAQKYAAAPINQCSSAVLTPVLTEMAASYCLEPK